MKEQPLCSDLIAPISGAEANAMAALSSEGRAEIFAGEIFETGRHH